MIKKSVARHINAKRKTSKQLALQADGQSSLIIEGETKTKLQQDGKIF